MQPKPVRYRSTKASDDSVCQCRNEKTRQSETLPLEIHVYDETININMRIVDIMKMFIIFENLLFFH